MKKIIILVSVIILLLGLFSLKSTDMKHVTTHISNKDSLIGVWKQLNPGTEEIQPKVEFSDTTYTFYIDDNEPYERTYHIYKDYIVGPEHPIIKKRDSIRFNIISRDTIILSLREKGILYSRKFYRID